MQAYDDDSLLGVPDPFGAARRALDALAAMLGSAEALGWPHDQLEDHLEARGREVLRLLLQDHLDLRAFREQRAVGQGRVEPVTDADGSVTARSSRAISGSWPRCSERWWCSGAPGGPTAPGTCIRLMRR